jgi:hypothetical protein
MMTNFNPFLRSLPLSSLHSPHPQPNDLAHAIKASSLLDFERLAELWMTEGIPFAFRSSPDLYQIVRKWLSLRLAIGTKDITLIGSGRFGYKLSDRPDFGRPFSNRSDLDLTIVSMPLYSKLEREATQWIQDFSSATIKPSHEKERKYWNQNKIGIPRQLFRGFIHYNIVPAIARYPNFHELGHSLYLLQNKLAITNGGIQITGATARVYKNWDSFTKQSRLNLTAIASSLKV